MVLQKLSFQVLIKSSSLPACSEKRIFSNFIILGCKTCFVTLVASWSYKTNTLRGTFLRELLPELCINKHLNYISCHVEQIRFLFINIKEAENKLNPK